MTSIDTIRAEIDTLNAKARAHQDTHNEGGYGYNPYDAKIDDACKRLREAKLADYAARWADIKATWNAALAKHTVNGRVDMRDLAKIETEAGISLSDMKIVKAMVEG